jgi:polysaccharide export outer membrane protein
VWGHRRVGEMRRLLGRVVGVLLGVCLGACSSGPPPPPPPADVALSLYVIGPRDKLSIFVWRNPELSMDVPVRPDGRISIPLVEDVVAIGKTPAQLAQEIAEKLSRYVTSPLVTVLPRDVVGPFNRQIRIIGEAAQPKAVAYLANMTLLDAMIEVGGLTRFAAGNRATLVRTINNTEETYSLQIDSLVKDGDIKSNVPLAPGDIIIIPQRFF